MVWGKNLAQFYLMFKTVPNAVYNPQLFKQGNRAVYRGAVNVRVYGARQLANTYRALFLQVFKQRNTFACGAAASLFKGAL